MSNDLMSKFNMKGGRGMLVFTKLCSFSVITGKKHIFSALSVSLSHFLTHRVNSNSPLSPSLWPYPFVLHVQKMIRGKW